LSGNLTDVEAFLESARPHFFDSNIVDTVDNRMAPLESNNRMESTTNHVDNSIAWWRTIGASEPVDFGALGQEKGVEEPNSQFFLLLAVPWRPLFCCCLRRFERHSTTNHRGKRCIEDMCTSLFLDRLDAFDFALLDQQNTHSKI
jgi:hypothetical protein